MSVPRWKLLSAPLVVIGLASPMLSLSSGCKKHDPNALSPVATSAPGVPMTCEEMRSGEFSGVQFTAAADVSARIKALLVGTHTLGLASVQFEKELIAACAELGTAAGVRDADLKAEPDAGKGAEKVCAAASNKTSEVMRKLKEAKVLLSVEYDPPRCYVGVEAAQKCLADCGSPSKVDIRAACTGGDLSGKCSGRCQGTCTMEASDASTSGACRGVCSGKCDHDFRGKCGGKCDGTCDGSPTKGKKKCVGICDGSCSEKGEGVCSGKCDGACSGPWEPREQIKCAGHCGGICAGGEVAAPQCSGEFSPPGLDSVCQASCGALSALNARCEAPVIRVLSKGGKQNADTQRFLAGVQSAYPKILRLLLGVGKKLPRAMEVAQTASVDWSNTYATANAKGLFCVRTAIDVLKASEANIDVAVKGASGIQPALKTDPLPTAGPSEDQ
jgi:hypothetical protein